MLKFLAGILILLLPLFLTHGRAPAEIAQDGLALLFLLHSARTRDWGWLRIGWVRIALAWWVWVVICSLHARTGQVQALALLRVPVFVAALECWVLRGAGLRRWVMRLVRLAAAYIAVQECLQLSLGANSFGIGREPSGELTGPYDQPRAGPVMSRILFPAVLPLAAQWRWQRGLLLVLAAVASVVLFGQRMPTLLTALGLLVSAVLLPRLRPVVLAGLVAGGALIGASFWLSPPTAARLVTKFSDQMADWPNSPYGQLAARAVSIAQAHPWMGAGTDAFRDACLNRDYWHGWPQVLRGETGFHAGPAPAMADPAVWDWLHALGGGYAICAQHPHNHYLQALEESGAPGLVLFCAMILAWLRALGRGLWRNPDPLRVGLFVAALVQEWPLASTSAFINMPLAGWFLLLLGLGLAEARWSAGGAAPISAARETRA